MKVNNLILPILVLGVCDVYASTSHRSFDELQITAKNALSNSTDISVSDVETLNGDTVCYTFKGNKGGYAIVSADTRVPALLAYSKEGEVTPELQSMLSFFVKEIDNNQHQNIDLSSGQSQLRATRIEDSAIEPLLGNITWGQSSPFNLNTPVFNQEHGPVGCAATAISQLLYYYRYPAATLSEIPSYTTATNKLNIDGVPEGTILDWDNMLDSYGDGYTEVQSTAVSNLMSVVGAAIGIDYKVKEGTCSRKCMEELVNIFGYDRDLIHVSYRSSFTFEEWSQLIYNELKNSRPVLMAGSTMKSGHSFLCDGIDKDGLFHINWGWDGRYNGYYDLALLNPHTTTEAGASTSTDGYSKDCYAVYGITPDNGVADASGETTAVEALSVKYQSSGGGHYLFFSYANNSLEEKSVHLANGYVDEKGKVVTVAPIGNYDLTPTSSYNQSNAYGIDVSDFEEGKYYKVGLVESKDGANWTPCTGFEHVSYTFTIKEGQLMVADKYELSVSVEVTDFNYLNQYAHGIIHLSNAGEKEYYNVLYLMTSSENVNPLKYSYAAYVTAEACNSNDVEFKFIPTADTMYYWVMDSQQNVIQTGTMHKQSKEYKLTAFARIDTTSAGNRMCRLYLKNEGDAFYDNIVSLSLYYTGGSTIITPDVYLEPGEETVVVLELTDDFLYTRYAVFDYNGEQFVSDDFVASQTDSGEIIVEFDFDHFYTTDYTVYATLVVNNGTSELLADTFFVASDSAGVDIQTFVCVEIPANSVQKIPLALKMDKDTCTLFVYRKADSVRYIYKMIVKDINAAVDDCIVSGGVSDLRLWSEGAVLIAEAVDDVTLQVSKVDGRILTLRRLRKGEVFTSVLPSGIYIVNGKKILIRNN